MAKCILGEVGGISDILAAEASHAMAPGLQKALLSATRHLLQSPRWIGTNKHHGGMQAQKNSAGTNREFTRKGKVLLPQHGEGFKAKIFYPYADAR